VRSRLIVVSRQADKRLRTDVLESGGFELLPSPTQEGEVLKCIERAWRDWWDEVWKEDWRQRAVSARAGTVAEDVMADLPTVEG
jgi:hypothetical protein